MSEAQLIVAGFNDVTVVGQSIEQGRRHLGITKYGWPFPNAKFVGGRYAGAFLYSKAAKTIYPRFGGGHAAHVFWIEKLFFKSLN